MKKVNVEIFVEGHNNFSASSIEDALNFYFGTHATFIVKESAQHRVQSDALPCGHDLNNLRMGVNGYGCAECAATRR